MPQQECPHCQHLTRAEAIIGEGRPDPLMIFPVSLRDYFAGMALQGLLACPEVTLLEVAASDAYKAADLMLSHRQASPQERP